MSEILAARDLYKSYASGGERLVVLRGINISLERGEMSAIIGPSGSGKSTLLHLLGGLDRPDSGEVLIESQNLYQVGEQERAQIRSRSIGFLFQFYHLLPEFSAEENLIFPQLIQGKDSGDARVRSRAMELLSEVGLAERASHSPAQLSGGEQQRVALARALMGDPDILLADEPTGNLDSKTADSVLQTLLDLHEKKGLASLIVTHDERLAPRCDKVWELRDGRLLPR